MKPSDRPVIYGHGERRPGSHPYLWPVVLDVCRRHGVRTALDIGCGNGTTCLELRKEGIEAIGMEPSADGFEIARVRLGDKGVYHAGVNDPSETVVEKDFDAVICTEVVEHLYAPAALPKFAKVELKADGILIVSTPFHGYLKNLAICLANKWDRHHNPLYDGGHIKFWSRGTLTALLESHGFSVVEFHGVGRLPLFWKSMVLVGQNCGT